MIIREPEDGFRLLISQPAHALLSGQMMAAWGAPGFARPDPAPEVILAAGHHDVAWMEWETAPTMDPGTGLPHPFTAMAPALHAPMWSQGVEWARAAWGLWPALLVSRHGSLIYTWYIKAEDQAPEDREAIARNVSRQRALQAGWIANLGAKMEQVETNSALVAVADSLSLALCFADPSKAGEAPMEDGSREPMRLTRLGPARWSLSPWPFAGERLVLRYDGIRLAEDLRWEDEDRMRQDLREAPRTPLTETLVPG